MAILDIRDWEPWECEVVPTTYEVLEPAVRVDGKIVKPAVLGRELSPAINIRMELKRLKRHEARPLLKVILAAFGEADKAKDDELTSSQRAAIVAAAYEMLPEDELKRWFSDCVQNVKDFKRNGQDVTTGAALLDNADDELLVKVLMKLHSLSRLSSAEGNASASRSTLQLVAGTNGGSPAASTEREAGTSPFGVSENRQESPSTPPV